MSEVVFRQVSKRFGATEALAGFDLTVDSGELVCLLGPSGCGKTTALRVLAGFEAPDAGEVLVAGRSVLNVDARRRGFGMVFQAYSLFPNMTARRNIGFALQLKGVRGESQRRRVDDLLEITGLTEHADKYPHQLSGGQQQRVALARALAIEPPVLLLDEPLSALDAAVREQLRVEIRRLQKAVGITTLFVTHDQHEAMAIADRIGVMERGRLVQLGPPAEVYNLPSSAFVSSFLGTSNRVPVHRHGNDALVLGARVEGLSNDAVLVFVRPEHVRLVTASEPSIPVTITDRWFLGPLTRLEGETGEHTLVIDLPSHEANSVAVGDSVHVTLDGPVLEVDGGAGS